MSDDYREPDLPKFEEPPSLPPDQPAVRAKVASLGRVMPPSRLARAATTLAVLPFVGLVSCGIAPLVGRDAWPLVAVALLGLVAGLLGALLGWIDLERGGSAGRRAMLVNLGLLAGHVAVVFVYLLVVLTH